MVYDINRFLWGQNPGFQQVTNLTPGQSSIQGQMESGVGNPLGSGFEYLQSILSGNPEAFKAFEAPYMQQFEQEIIPGISERFAGMGSGGAQDSSAFQQTLGRAGKELSTNLAAMREGLKSNALQQLQGLVGQTQRPTFQNAYEQGDMGAILSFLSSLAGGAAKAGTRSLFGA